MAHIPISQIEAIHSALSELIRIKLVRLLLDRELCVCELVGALEEPQYKVSRHLAILKNAGLVQDKRESIWMIYSIDPNLAPEWLSALKALSQVWDYNNEIQNVLHRRETMQFKTVVITCNISECCND